MRGVGGGVAQVQSPTREGEIAGTATLTEEEMEAKQARRAGAPGAEGHAAEHPPGSSPGFMTCPLPMGLSPVSGPRGWEARVLTGSTSKAWLSPSPAGSSSTEQEGEAG